MIQLFPLPDDAPHTILICAFLCVSLSALWTSGLQLQMGERGRQGKKAVKAFYQEKGCSLLASVKEFRIPGLLVDLQWDAKHSLLLLLAPGQLKLMASWLPAAPCSSGLWVQIPCWDTLLSSWESTGVPVSNAGLGFNPRNQPLSIKNET